MERLPKRTRKISTAKALGLDTKDPSDKNYLRYESLLLGLRKIMRRRGVSGNKLAKMMGISRQAIYDRFAGRNTTLEWISRVAEVLIEICNISPLYLHKRDEFDPIMTS